MGTLGGPNGMGRLEMEGYDTGACGGADPDGVPPPVFPHRGTGGVGGIGNGWLLPLEHPPRLLVFFYPRC